MRRPARAATPQSSSAWRYLLFAVVALAAFPFGAMGRFLTAIYFDDSTASDDLLYRELSFFVYSFHGIVFLALIIAILRLRVVSLLNWGLLCIALGYALSLPLAEIFLSTEQG